MTRSARVAIALLFACIAANARAGSPPPAQPYSFAELLRVTEQTAEELGARLPDGIDAAGMTHEAADIVVEPGDELAAAAPAPGWPGGMDGPRPAGWLMLASGLAIAGFIGRHRAKPVD